MKCRTSPAEAELNSYIPTLFLRCLKIRRTSNPEGNWDNAVRQILSNQIKAPETTGFLQGNSAVQSDIVVDSQYHRVIGWVIA